MFEQTHGSLNGVKLALDLLVVFLILMFVAGGVLGVKEKSEALEHEKLKAECMIKNDYSAEKCDAVAFDSMSKKYNW